MLRIQNNQVLECVITNIDLPVDYDELPESFKDMTKKAYDIQVCKDMEVYDFDLVKDRYTPLREPKKPIIGNTDYNKVLHKVFAEMGMSHLLN